MGLVRGGQTIANPLALLLGHMQAGELEGGGRPGLVWDCPVATLALWHFLAEHGAI